MEPEQHGDSFNEAKERKDIKELHKYVKEYYDVYSKNQYLPQMGSVHTLTSPQEIKNKLPLSHDWPPQDIGNAKTIFSLDSVILPALQKIKKYKYFRKRFLRLFLQLWRFAKQYDICECLRWIKVYMSCFMDERDQEDKYDTIQSLRDQFLRKQTRPVFGSFKQVQNLLNGPALEIYQLWSLQQKGQARLYEEEVIEVQAIYWQIRLRLFIIFFIVILMSQYIMIGLVTSKIQAFFKDRSHYLQDLKKKLEDLQKSQQEDVNERRRKQRIVDQNTIQKPIDELSAAYQETSYLFEHFLVIDSEISKDFFITFYKDKLEKIFRNLVRRKQNIEQAIQSFKSGQKCVLIININNKEEFNQFVRYYDRFFSIFYHGAAEFILPNSPKIHSMNHLKKIDEKIAFIIKKVHQEIEMYNYYWLTPNFSVVNEYQSKKSFKIRNSKAKQNLKRFKRLLQPYNVKRCQELWIQFVEYDKYLQQDPSQLTLKKMIQQIENDNFEDQVMKNYTASSFFYKKINNGMRSFKNRKHWLYIRYPITCLFFAVYNKYLQNPLPELSTFYRTCFLTEEELHFFEKASKKGLIIQSEGFWSTSSRILDFGNQLITIIVPKTREFTITGYFTLEQTYNKENQVLFNPHNYFKVKQFRKSSKEDIQHQIDIELVSIEQLKLKPKQDLQENQNQLLELVDYDYFHENAKNLEEHHNEILEYTINVDQKIESMSKQEYKQYTKMYPYEIFDIDSKQGEFLTLEDLKLIDHLIWKYFKHLRDREKIRIFFIRYWFEQFIQYLGKLYSYSHYYFMSMVAESSPENLFEIINLVLNIVSELLKKYRDDSDISHNIIDNAQRIMDMLIDKIKSVDELKQVKEKIIKLCNNKYLNPEKQKQMRNRCQQMFEQCYFPSLLLAQKNQNHSQFKKIQKQMDQQYESGEYEQFLKSYNQQKQYLLQEFSSSKNLQGLREIYERVCQISLCKVSCQKSKKFYADTTETLDDVGRLLNSIKTINQQISLFPIYDQSKMRKSHLKLYKHHIQHCLLQKNIRQLKNYCAKFIYISEQPQSSSFSQIIRQLLISSGISSLYKQQSLSMSYEQYQKKLLVSSGATQLSQLDFILVIQGQKYSMKTLQEMMKHPETYFKFIKDISFEEIQVQFKWYQKIIVISQALINSNKLQSPQILRQLGDALIECLDISKDLSLFQLIENYSRKMCEIYLMTHNKQYLELCKKYITQILRISKNKQIEIDSEIKQKIQKHQMVLQELLQYLNLYGKIDDKIAEEIYAEQLQSMIKHKFMSNTMLMPFNNKYC